MKRAHFLRIGIVATAGVMVAPGGAAATLSPPSDLDEWLTRYRGSIDGSGRTIRMIGRPRVGELGPALRELEALTDGNLRCAGSKLNGKVQERPFEMVLRPA